MNFGSFQRHCRLISLAAILIAISPVRAQYRIHPAYHPYWGCFGYCRGPLNPRPSPHWGCFGYCPGPITPTPHWGCFGYCPGPIRPYPYPLHWGCYGYCPRPVDVVVNAPTWGIVHDTPPSASDQPAPATPPAGPIHTEASPDSSQTVDDLIKQLKSKNSRLRGEAVEKLEAYGPKAARAVDALMPLLADKSPAIRLETSFALAKIGSASLPALRNGLTSSEKMIQIGSALTLGHMGKQASAAIPDLEKLLSSSELALSGHAAQAIWRIDPSQAGEVITVLTKVLKSKEPAERMGALSTLSQMGPSARETIEEIRPLLRDSEAQIRLSAAITLWNIDPKQEGIVPILAAALTDKPPLSYDAVHALQHLAKSGERGFELVNALSKAVQESDQLALAAAVGLSYLGAGGVPPLKDALRDPRPDVRISAATALSHIGGPARSALSALESLAKNDPIHDVRSAAMEASAEISADTSP
jgi:HEAT repeat protein